MCTLRVSPLSISMRTLDPLVVDGIGICGGGVGVAGDIGCNNMGVVVVAVSIVNVVVVVVVEAGCGVTSSHSSPSSS